MSDSTQFRVLDFDCPSCANTVERAISNLAGVEDVEVHYTTGRVKIDFDDGIANTEEFARTIENQGYTPRPA